MSIAGSGGAHHDNQRCPYLTKDEPSSAKAGEVSILANPTIAARCRLNGLPHTGDGGSSQASSRHWQPRLGRHFARPSRHRRDSQAGHCLDEHRRP